ncbi:MAG: DNA-3-methyladenine glycosylase I [Geminicoccaceae bacterium]
MKHFSEIYALAATRKGGETALETLLADSYFPTRTTAELESLGDDRYLSDISRRVFQAGFNWKVIDNKWDGFEEAFDGFDPRRWRMMTDEDLDRLLADERIVRHAKKILSVRDNAHFLCELADEHGSAAKAIARWPARDFVGLLTLMKEKGSRLGGTTAQYMLRGIGKDSFLLSKDVVSALIREGVVDKAPGSKKTLRQVQDGFNHWLEQGGGSLTRISRILAMSTSD